MEPPPQPENRKAKQTAATDTRRAAVPSCVLKLEDLQRNLRKKNVPRVLALNERDIGAGYYYLSSM